MTARSSAHAHGPARTIGDRWKRACAENPRAGQAEVIARGRISGPCLQTDRTAAGDDRRQKASEDVDRIVSVGDCLEPADGRMRQGKVPIDDRRDDRRRAPRQRPLHSAPRGPNGRAGSHQFSCPLLEHLSTMSAYEDYTAVSADYDRTRIPIGIEIILGCLAASGRPLTSLHLLDAGCGDRQLHRGSPPARGGNRRGGPESLDAGRRAGEGRPHSGMSGRTARRPASTHFRSTMPDSTR